MRTLLFLLAISCTAADPTEGQATVAAAAATSPCPLPASCPTPLPSCADLGCPYKPSGSPLIWEPCFAEQCWCGSPAVACDRYA